MLREGFFEVDVVVKQWRYLITFLTLVFPLRVVDFTTFTPLCRAGVSMPLGVKISVVVMPELLMLLMALLPPSTGPSLVESCITAAISSGDKA